MHCMYSFPTHVGEFDVVIIVTLILSRHIHIPTTLSVLLRMLPPCIRRWAAPPTHLLQRHTHTHTHTYSARACFSEGPGWACCLPKGLAGWVRDACAVLVSGGVSSWRGRVEQAHNNNDCVGRGRTGHSPFRPCRHLHRQSTRLVCCQPIGGPRLPAVCRRWGGREREREHSSWRADRAGRWWAPPHTHYCGFHPLARLLTTDTTRTFDPQQRLVVIMKASPVAHGGMPTGPKYVSSTAARAQAADGHVVLRRTPEQARLRYHGRHGSVRACATDAH